MIKDAMNELDSVYKQFESWLCTQPCWLQDAAYRIYHGQEITESIISKYADMCVAQVKKETPHFMHLAENETKNTTETPEISVTALSEVSGVNALSPDASLHFLPHGVTVVYGLNGAGNILIRC